MYVSMKDILTHADKHNYAVMAVNSVKYGNGSCGYYSC